MTNYVEDNRNADVFHTSEVQCCRCQPLFIR